MATAVIIWDRKSRTVVPTNGATYPTSADANAAIARRKTKNSEDSGKTYDVLTVNV
jgi:hypothetical protein